MDMTRYGTGTLPMPSVRLHVFHYGSRHVVTTMEFYGDSSTAVLSLRGVHHTAFSPKGDCHRLLPHLERAARPSFLSGAGHAVSSLRGTNLAVGLTEADIGQSSGATR